MTGKYDDIIDLPHHVSSTRARMSMQDRAAQFSPFAALSGHDAAIREVERASAAQSGPDEYADDEIFDMSPGVACGAGRGGLKKPESGRPGAKLS